MKAGQKLGLSYFRDFLRYPQTLSLVVLLTPPLQSLSECGCDQGVQKHIDSYLSSLIPRSEKMTSQRECKLFSPLLQHLAKGSSAFAILNSSAQVDIESMAWSAVPDDVRQMAVDIGSKLIAAGASGSRKETILGWTAHFSMIVVVPTFRWCAITAATDDPELAQPLATEDTRPIFPISP